MSSAGSPAWASSQSSTPRRPSAPTRRLPQRKSPWTVTRGPGSGRCAASQRAPSSSAGRTSPRASSRGRGSRSGSARGSPSTPAGSMAWMAARARPHCAVSAPRAVAHSPSRRILRGMVSPSSRSTTNQAGPMSSSSPMATTRGTGTPTAPAASSRSRSVRVLPCVGPRPRSTWRMSARRPSATSSSNALVTREAPPESRRRPCTRPPRRRPSAPASSSPRLGVGHRCGYSTGTTGLPAPSSWCRYSQMPYPVRVPPSASS